MSAQLAALPLPGTDVERVRALAYVLAVTYQELLLLLDELGAELPPAAWSEVVAAGKTIDDLRATFDRDPEPKRWRRVQP